MAKKNDVVLDEIDAFLEQETAPKKKRAKKEKIVEEVVVEEITDEVVLEKVEVKKRGKKKKEVIEEPVNIEEVKEEPKEEKKPKKVKDSKKVSQDEEDLYLTQSFKPIRTRRRLKKGVIKFFRNLIIFGILGALGYFGYLKVSEIYNMLKPVNVYKEVIKGLEEAAVAELYILPRDGDFEVEVSVDTNMKGYEYFNGNTMSYTYNYLENGYEDLLKVNDLGIYTLRNDESTYVQYTNSSNIFEAEERVSMWAEIATGVFETRDNLKDIIEGNSDILIDILEEDDVETDSEEMNINDLSLDVKCHTVKLTDDLINRYLVQLFKDRDLVDNMAKFMGMDVEDFKEDYEKSLLKLSGKVNFNVYVHKLTFVGFDIEVDGFREAQMYEYENEYDYKINGLYSIFGVEGLEADFHLSGNNSDDDTAVLLEDSDEEIVFGYMNTKVTVNSNEWKYEYKKGDNYATVIVKFKDGKDLNLSVDNLITSTKSIDKEHVKFEKELTENEVIVYLVESAFIYG